MVLYPKAHSNICIKKQMQRMINVTMYIQTFNNGMTIRD